MQPPPSMDQNSMNTDIVHGVLALKLLNRVLTLCACLHQKLPMVTNYVVEVIAIRQINMFM